MLFIKVNLSRWSNTDHLSDKEDIERIVKRKTPADGLLKKRNELFEQFQKCYLTNDHVYTDEELSELAKEYDCLICGSDQIWNPNVARPGYFLKGVEGTRKGILCSKHCQR